MRSGLARLWMLSGYARRRGIEQVLQLIASAYRDTQIGGSATASFTLASNGQAAGGPSLLSGSAAYAWLTGALASLFEVDVTPTSGTFSSGPTGTSNLGTTRTWTVTRTSNGSKQCLADFVIRPAGGGATLVSGQIDLMATIDPGTGGGGGGYEPPWDNPYGGGPNVN